MDFNMDNAVTAHHTPMSEGLQAVHVAWPRGVNMTASGSLCAALLLMGSCIGWAETATARDLEEFRSPTGNIVCGFRDVDGIQAVRCDIIERSNSKPVVQMPADCDLDWGNMFVVGRDGEAGLECAGDLAASSESPVLAYDAVTKRYGITCMSQKAGLTCINGDGHGFTLSRARQKLF
jgi:hypothetical protein